MSLRSSPAAAVALVTFATFIDLIAYSICVPVLPDLAQRLGATPTMIGVLFGSFGITLLAVSVPMGAVSDAIGRRGPLVASAVGLAGATALFAFSDTLPWLFAARLLQGAADGVMWVAGFALIADLYGPEDRGRVMGYVMSGTSVGVMIGPSIGGWLYEAGGMRLPFLFVAGLSLVCAAGFFAMTPPRRDHAVQAPSIWSVLRVGDVARCAGFVIVTAMTFAMFEPVLPLFYARSLGLSPVRVGLLFGTGAIASAVMPFVYGPLIAKWGARPMTIVGLLLTALGLPLMGLAQGFRSAMLLTLIEWTATALILTPSLAYMAEVTSFAGAAAYGIGYGVYNTAWAVGILIGPAAGGFLFERLGFERLTLGWAPFVIAMTILLAFGGGGRAPAGNKVDAAGTV
jgi:MFS transporter, DHA1 family, solute carrier family 18 (vesicular amine transporter), member 1/2